MVVVVGEVEELRAAGKTLAKALASAPHIFPPSSINNSTLPPSPLPPFSQVKLGLARTRAAIMHPAKLRKNFAIERSRFDSNERARTHFILGEARNCRSIRRRRVCIIVRLSYGSFGRRGENERRYVRLDTRRSVDARNGERERERKRGWLAGRGGWSRKVGPLLRAIPFWTNAGEGPLF